MATTVEGRGSVAVPVLGWRRLARWSGIGGIGIIAIATALFGFFPPMLLFVAVWAVGAWLVDRPTKTGPIVLIVGFAAFLLLDAPLLIQALGVPASVADFVLASAIFVVGVVGITASVASLRGSEAETSGAPRRIAVAAAAVISVAVLVAMLAAARWENAVARAGDFRVRTEGNEFTEEVIRVDRGQAIFVENEDREFHTFTVDGLGIDVNIPAGASVRIPIEGPSGSYRFFCRPHESEMEGQLLVGG